MLDTAVTPHRLGTQRGPRSGNSSPRLPPPVREQAKGASPAGIHQLPLPPPLKTASEDQDDRATSRAVLGPGCSDLLLLSDIVALFPVVLGEGSDYGHVGSTF